MNLEYVVDKKFDGKTIKDILIVHFNISHRLLITLKRQNCIYLNGIQTHIYKCVKLNDKVVIDLNYKEDNSNIIPKDFPLDIVYEDDWLLVINKEAGIPVHPSILHYEDSISNIVRNYYDTIGLKKKIRPVNRIDKNTSGLVVFAKNEYIQEELIKQMKDGNFYKEYIAVVDGIFDTKEGVINAPIARKENSIIQRCVSDKNGESAITKYEVLDEIEINLKKISIVKCILETGRTHQIRVHMSYISHPLLGDDLYGGSNDLLNRQALHSYKISFIHPISREKVEFIAKIPPDLKKFIKQKR